MIRISQSELDVMDVLWREAPLAASTVIERLAGSKDWSGRTIKTLLARLVEKGALSTSQDGRRYLYTPLVTRKAYASNAARRLSDRLFGGKAAPLVAHLAEGEGLTPEDIAELEALIAGLKS
ncbi:MAG: BlaI/MecI/CopY family transcriptional regulator [Maricaulaceae bacterium]